MGFSGVHLILVIYFIFKQFYFIFRWDKYITKIYHLQFIKMWELLND